MPFDTLDFPGGGPNPATSRRLVALWLFGVCAMVWVMVVLGGATRLTGSGLSIMEWAPIMGALPPWSEAEWQRLFALYQQIPQYSLLHDGFGLDGFKHIFWLEWTHRLWGRLIGLAFLVPFIAFAVTGRIERRLYPRLALLFVLGGLQGAVGWFMVASGFFPDTTAVSPYRLVIHLALALALYAALLWTGLSVLRRPAMPAGAVRWLARALLATVAVTIVAGGFVAGTHAGLDYNTFPLMAGQVVPDGYLTLSPAWRNLFENVAAVQFDHRLLATLTAALALATIAAGWRNAPLRPRLALLAAAVAAQYALGVATLLGAVPIGLATLHQATSVLVLTAALLLVHATRIPAARLEARRPARHVYGRRPDPARNQSGRAILASDTGGDSDT
jgi:cytochrome c oxidase assembly protein subunit 15